MPGWSKCQDGQHGTVEPRCPSSPGKALIVRSHAAVVNVSDTPSVNNVTSVAGAVDGSPVTVERVTHLQAEKGVHVDGGLLRDQIDSERFRTDAGSPLTCTSHAAMSDVWVRVDLQHLLGCVLVITPAATSRSSS